MESVPPDYLLFLFRQPWIRDWPDLHTYLVENQDALMLEDADNEAAQGQGEFQSFEDYMRYGRD